MIFLSTGTQLPFKRLADFAEQWVQNNPGRRIVGQIGELAADGTWHFEAHVAMDTPSFRSCVQQCDAVVSHAGMGNIITALEFGKPIVIVPRLERFGEHRNDHQLHTAKRFGSYDGVFVAHDYDEFCSQLSQALGYKFDFGNGGKEREALLQAVRRFLVAL